MLNVPNVIAYQTVRCCTNSGRFKYCRLKFSTLHTVPRGFTLTEINVSFSLHRKKEVNIRQLIGIQMLLSLWTDGSHLSYWIPRRIRHNPTNQNTNYWLTVAYQSQPSESTIVKPTNQKVQINPYYLRHSSLHTSERL